MSAAGELTVNRCPGLAVLEIDLIKVKGRARPTRIFGLADVLSRGAEEIAWLRPLHQEFLQAYRAQKWDETEMLIAQCRKAGIEALDTYYGVFAARIKKLRGAALDPDWDGAYTITEKRSPSQSFSAASARSGIRNPSHF